jgi:superfamily II DNA or RNA helicase
VAGNRLVFDRGTLVLAGAPAPRPDEPRGSELPGMLFDPRIDGFRAPAYFYADLAAALADRASAPRDSVLEDAACEDWRDVDLRPYQQAALLAWRLSGSRGVVVLPTGSGKTRVALAAMAAAGRSSLCIVPTRALMHQWKQALREAYEGPVGVLGDAERSLAPITVATFESALRWMPRIGHRFRLLVVDEVHHFGTGRRDEALEMCAAPLRLGLTATPAPEPAALRIEERIGPVAYRLAIDDLAGRYLADFDTVVLWLQLDPDERRAYDTDVEIYRRALRHFHEVRPGGSWPEFVALASRSQEGRAALSAWRRSQRLLALPRAKRRALEGLLARHTQSRMLVFTADNDSAYRIAREQLVMPLTCDIGRAERGTVLEAFREGRLRALVSSRVLNEGLDVPDADVAIVVGGTLGEREHVQRVGRLLRPRPGKRAIIYELVTRTTSETRQAARRRRGLGGAHAFHPTSSGAR